MSRSFGGRVCVLALVVGLAVAGGAFGQAPWTAPDTEKGKKNPLTTDAKGVELGAKIAKLNCASCHGAKGKGDGAAAVALSPKPADWTSDRVQQESDGELFWKISNGRGPMPPWKHLSENDRWAVILYIRSLKK